MKILKENLPKDSKNNPEKHGERLTKNQIMSTGCPIKFHHASYYSFPLAPTKLTIIHFQKLTVTNLKNSSVISHILKAPFFSNLARIRFFFHVFYSICLFNIVRPQGGAMFFLFLFVFATLMALLLFDYYEHEVAYRMQTKSYVERLTEPEYRHTSIFALLGLAREKVNTFKAFRDHFKSFAEVSAAMRRTGLHQARVIVGIDFSASNEWQGRRTFRGECLHTCKGVSVYNPYQKVLCILGQAFQPLVHGYPIPAFGFGDTRSRDMSVFPLRESGTPCMDFVDVLDSYNHMVTKIHLGGPTNFSPLIERAVSIVRQTKAFHILLIITDGQMSQGATATRQAIVQASRSALSIVTVGVGDGPWDLLEECDDQLTARAFDNFQFVNYQDVIRTARNPETALALQALMEVPDQYQTILRLGYLSPTDKG